MLETKAERGEWYYKTLKQQFLVDTIFCVLPGLQASNGALTQKLTQEKAVGVVLPVSPTLNGAQAQIYGKLRKVTGFARLGEGGTCPSASSSLRA